jgi:hypothetical protein
MMKTRGAAPHVGTAAFSPSLEQYALRLLAALRQAASCDDGESVTPPLCSVGFDFRY